LGARRLGDWACEYSGIFYKIQISDKKKEEMGVIDHVSSHINSLNLNEIMQ